MIGALVLLCPGCGSADWDRVCSEFEAKAEQCAGASATAISNCSEATFGRCLNESEIADEIEECTAKSCDEFWDCSKDPHACAM
ncbi:MAG: hypothetical protein HY744_31835 [Deltaproteobacteria bacterium]|nr:hypothetical protein [Deltaproteobacteria bacterium]